MTLKKGDLVRWTGLSLDDEILGIVLGYKEEHSESFALVYWQNELRADWETARYCFKENTDESY